MQTEAPSQVPRIADGPGRSEGPPPDISIRQVSRFVHRHLVVLGAAVAIAVAVAVGWAVLVVEDAWQARTILIVDQPTFSSKLTPAVPTAHAFREMLQSSAVMRATHDRLARENGLAWVPMDVRSEILLDGGSHPMLRLVAQADTPELAASIANTWAEVAIDESGRLLAASAQRSVALVEDHYDQARARLQELETENVELRLDFEGQTNDITVLWERRIAAARAETEELAAAYRIETRALFRDVAARRGLGGGAAPSLPPGLEDLRGRLLQLTALRGELAATLPYLALEKTVSDDALWQWLGDEAVEAESQLVRQLNNLTALRLNDHEINPVYIDLRRHVLELELAIQEDGRLDGWQGAAALLEELERTYHTRSAGLTNLLSERQSLHNRLRAAYRAEIGALRHRFRTDIARVRREIDLAAHHLESLASNFEDAQLARAELETLQPTVAVLSAVLPAQPQPRRLLLRALAAVVVGLFAGLVVAGVREVRSSRMREGAGPA